MFGINKVEKDFKRFLKRKIKITQAVFVAFLISGSLSYAEVSDADFNALKQKVEKLEELKGKNNTISAEKAVILGGQESVIKPGAESAAIIGGRKHSIDADDAVILGGGENSKGGNTIGSNGENSVIAGGYLNLANGLNTGILGGNTNKVTEGNNSSIVGGYNNTVSNKNAGVFVGHDNTVSVGESAIVAGAKSKVSGENSVVIGGWTHDISGSYSAIVVGKNNKVSGENSVILGGYSNKADKGATNSIVAGGYDNLVSADKAVILGGNENKATADYATVISGYQNIASGMGSAIINGTSNKASGHRAVIAGGKLNNVSGENAGTLGGYENNVSGENSVILGGEKNRVSRAKSAIIGGKNHLIEAEEAVIIGGGEGEKGNTAKGENSVILGGYSNVTETSGTNSIVAGGYSNLVSADKTVILGGENNKATADYAAVISGSQNIASGMGSAVINGTSNKASGHRSVIVGGKLNKVSGENAGVFGGYHGDNSGVRAILLGGDANKVSGTNAIVMGGYQNEATKESSIVSAGSRNKVLGSYSGVFAGQSNIIDENKTNSVILGGGSSIIRSSYAAIVGGSNNKATASRTSVIGGYLNEVTKEDSAVIAGVLNKANGPDSAIIAGRYNKTEGQNAVVVGGGGTNAATGNIASGTSSGILAGTANKATKQYSAVVGGQSNTTSGDRATALGGSSNTASGLESTIQGGRYNKTEGSFTAVTAGEQNVVSADDSGIFSGQKNAVKGMNSAIVAGRENSINSGTKTGILAGYKNKIENNAHQGAIVGGQNNTVSGRNSVVIGGGSDVYNHEYGNTASGISSSVIAGYSNTASGDNAVVIGGNDNTSSGTSSGTFAGANNQATNTGAVVIGGQYNVASTVDSSILGGHYNEASGNRSTVLGGGYNVASGRHAAILGGGGDNKVEGNIASGSHSAIVGGHHNKVSGEQAVVIGGMFNNASGAQSGIFGGRGNTVGGTYSATLGGIGNNVSGNSSYAIGSSNTISGNNTYVLGSNVENGDANNAVVLGDHSAAVSGAISVGKKGGERQIKHVKDGEISDTSTDAINGSQVTTMESLSSDQLKVTLDTSKTDHKHYKLELQKASLMADAATGTISVGKGDANKLVTASDIASAINDSGFVVKASNDGKGTSSGETDQLLKTGETLNLEAGENINIAQAGSKFTIKAKADGTITGSDEKIVTGKTVHNYLTTNYYTQTEVNTKLDGKVDKTSVHKIIGDTMINVDQGDILANNVNLSIKDGSITGAKIANNTIVEGNIDSTLVSKFMDKTKLKAGTNTSLSGSGSSTDPYVVDVDLSSVTTEAKKRNTVKASDNIDVTEKTNASGGIEYTIKAKADGEIAGSDEKIVSGKTVHKYLTDNYYTQTEVNTKLDEKVNKDDVHDITGDGIITVSQPDILTGDVALSIKDGSITEDKIDSSLVSEFKKKAKLVAGLNTTVEGNGEEGSPYKVNVDLSGVEAEAAKHNTVKAGDNVNITEKVNTNGGTEFTVNVITDGKVANDETGDKIVTGKTVYTAIEGAKTTLTDLGFNLTGDSGDVVHKNLGENIKLAGDTNIKTTGINSAGEVQFTLEKNLKGMESISAGETGAKISLGIDKNVTFNGGQIKGISKGIEDTDAVNVSQLNAVKSEAEKDLAELDKKITNVSSVTENITKNGTWDIGNDEGRLGDVGLNDKVDFVDGTGTSMEVSKTEDGYKISVDVNTEDISIEDGRATSITNQDIKDAEIKLSKAKTDEEKKKAKDDLDAAKKAANNKIVTASEVVDAINEANWTLYSTKVDKSNGVSTYNKEARAAEKRTAIKAGSKFNLNAGNNIKISGSGENMNIALMDEISVDKITIGDINISEEGINAGDKVISNVKAGEELTDAANVGQLQSVADVAVENAKNIGKLGNRIDHVGSLGAALAGLHPMQYDPLHPNQLMAAVGSYRDSQSVAVGATHYFNENLMMTGGISLETGSSDTEVMANLGVTWKLGDDEDREFTNLPERYDGRQMASIYMMQTEMDKVLYENQVEREKNEKLEMKVASQDETIKNLTERLKKIEKMLEKR